MAGCPAYVAEFFTRLVPLVRPMAKRLGIDEDYLLALSVHEHGWADSHNDKLHNLFGTTHGGGNNLSYASYEEAAQSWEAHYGGGVRDSKTIDDFVSRIRAMGYNTKDKNYDAVMVSTYRSLVKRKADCGVK